MARCQHKLPVPAACNRRTCRGIAVLSAVLLACPVLAAPELQLDMNVDVPVPPAGQPVEFVVTVTNSGDEAATDVRLEDRLPPELAIPDGAAAFVTAGDYDAVSGLWMLGDLAPGTAATLTLPAIVLGSEVDAETPCIANFATASFANDPALQLVSARAVLRLTPDAVCVDVGAGFAIYLGENVFPECDRRDRYHGYILVTNDGPDAAQGVLLTLTQEDAGAPSIRIDDDDCDGRYASRCSLGKVEADSTIVVSITSDVFQNYSGFQHQVEVSVTSLGHDYHADNDVYGESVFGQPFSSCENTFDFDLDDIPVAGVPVCFIATAAYGSGFDPHVETLRRFRDDYLAKSSAGQAFVRFYYRNSPPIAAYIADRPALRWLVRAVLTPLVYIIRFPLAVLLLLLFLRIALPFIRRRAQTLV